jgi:hypothetical protein
MSAYQYELLKCEGCHQTLGYIYVSAKLGFSGMIATRYWNLHNQPALEIEKTAFCENCFQKKLDEISKGEPEPKPEKDKSVEPRTKSKGRPLVR